MSTYYIIWAKSPSTNQEKFPETQRSLITEDEVKSEGGRFIEKLKSKTGIVDWELAWKTEEVPHEYR